MRDLQNFVIGRAIETRAAEWIARQLDKGKNVLLAKIGIYLLLVTTAVVRGLVIGRIDSLLINHMSTSAEMPKLLVVLVLSFVITQGSGFLIRKYAPPEIASELGNSIKRHAVHLVSLTGLTMLIGIFFIQ